MTHHSVIRQVVVFKSGETTIRDEAGNETRELSTAFLNHFPVQTKFLIETTGGKVLTVHAQVPGSDTSTDVSNLYFETEIGDSLSMTFVKKEKDILSQVLLTSEGPQEYTITHAQWSKDKILQWFMKRYDVNTKLEVYKNSEGDLTRLVINGQVVTGEAAHALQPSRALSVFSEEQNGDSWVLTLLFLVLVFVFAFLQYSRSSHTE